MARPVEEDDGGIGDAGNPVGGGSTGSENASIIGKNLRDSNNVSIRPKNLSSAHLYNLRNQSWAIPRLSWSGGDDTGSLQDPIAAFHNAVSSQYWPSNADTVNYSLYANTASENDKTMDRLNIKDLVNNPPGNSLAAMGHYVIDALERGSSRVAAVAQEKIQYPSLIYTLSSIPADRTPGGPSVACEYAGRVFYGGFSGEIIDGDANSPRMSSYVLFSQLVTDSSSVTSCYQQADPTNKDENDLVDTDGGFVRVEGAYRIVGLVNIGTNLAILASNGVWLLTGGDQGGFKATDYKVNKVTNSGCISPGSIVVVDNTVYYWGADGIYLVAPNQFGDYQSQNITEKTIQKFYSDITTIDVLKCEGVYDSYEKKIKWLYGNTIAEGVICKELILDISLGAFYTSVLPPIASSIYPKVVKGVQTEPYSTGTSQDTVVSAGDSVTVNGDVVVVSVENTSPSIKEISYVILKAVNPGSPIIYGFGSYRDTNHEDWKHIDGGGTDAPAYLLTGTFIGNDSARKKTIPYVTVHMRKTETNFVLDEVGDYEPNDQSSCLMQAQWNWSNSPNSGQWSRESQVYRHKRHFIPTDTGTFDNGYYVVETRNKLRGSGKSVSLLFKTEPGKHCDLLGWSVPVETATDV